MGTLVVYVHGLWMTGLEGSLLCRRLSKALSADCAAFRYRSVRADLAVNAASLAAFARRRAATLHLVAHSLGGLVVLRMFEDRLAGDLPPGRIVLLGSPLRGCVAARNLSQWWLGRELLGRSLGEAMHPGERRWDGQRELGIIAGDLSVGLGRLAGTRGHESDGTVLVEETRLNGARQHLVLPVSHTGLPFAASVARQTATFLATGRFEDQ
jgi:pimeloyl-ACP methyl ester carboxylesterase